MSQFSGSLGAFSSRSYVTSAANAGIAMAARLIDANAASLPVVDMQLLPLPIVIGANPGNPYRETPDTPNRNRVSVPIQQSRENASGCSSASRGPGGMLVE